ncbi:MAG: hypothetical protein M3Y50_12430 [Acidobacteriota bacterium]|nr:hypothetical protein [Acidobacteriota bacterium]
MRMLKNAVSAAVMAVPLCIPTAHAQDGTHILSEAQARGRRILIVTGETEKERPNDDLLVKKHLEAQGYVVTMGKEDDAAVTSGEDLIILSSTADPRVLGQTYAASTMPVFTWNAVDYPNMWMTGPERHVDFETLDPVQDYMRAFSVLYGYFTNVATPIVHELGIPRSQMFGTLYLEPQAFGWGKPAPSADILVSIEGDPTHAGVFTYEKGSTMYNSFVAPARRVGFYLQNGTFHHLTEVHGQAEKDPDLAAWWTGRKLFDISVRWALSAPAMPETYNPAALKTRLASVAKGKKILFVRRLETPEGEESDNHIAEHLKELGFVVKEADQGEPASVAEGQDAIIVSATASKYKMSNKYRDAKIPILCLEGLMADTLKMANRRRYTDYGEHGEAKESEDPPESYLEIVNSSHMMAAGLKPGYVKYIKEPDVLKWAMPLPSAIVIAMLPNSFHERAIFGYEKGSTMADEFVAPARRTLLPVDNPAFDDLTEQGHALFDATLLWTISPPSH